MGNHLDIFDLIDLWKEVMASAVASFVLNSIHTRTIGKEMINKWASMEFGNR